MNKPVLIFLLSFTLIAQTKLDEANELMLKSRFSEAIPLLQNYLENNNKNSEAFLKLGICHKNLMKNNEALYNLEKANQLKSEDTDILINLASVYSAVDFQSKAVQTYEQVMELDSTNIFASINLAKLYLETGKFSEAKSIYQNLLMNDSSNSFYFRQIAYIYQKENELEKAFQFYKKSFELNSQDIFTASNLAKIYYDKEKIDSAIAAVDKALKTFPNNTQLLKIKADIYYSIKRYDSAVNSIVKIIAAGDESAQLYQRLGACYYQLAVENFVGEAQVQKLESAVDALMKSTKMDSTQSLTELYLGMTYKELEKNKAAIKHLQKAAELIYPKFTSAIFTNLAIANKREGNYADAIKNFKRAKKFDKSNPNYFYYLASTYDQYYYDKKVPLIYYQTFLAGSDSLDPSLKNYAEQRIKKLKEEVHFQNGHKNK